MYLLGYMEMGHPLPTFELAGNRPRKVWVVPHLVLFLPLMQGQRLCWHMEGFLAADVQGFGGIMGGSLKKIRRAIPTPELVNLLLVFLSLRQSWGFGVDGWRFPFETQQLD